MKSLIHLTFLIISLASCSATGGAQVKESPADLKPKGQEAQAADDDRAYSAKEVDVKAKVTNRLEHIPEAKRGCPMEGSVRLRVVLHKSGKVTEVEVLKGLGCSYDEAAVEAVRKYKFTPALKDSKPVSQYQIVEYRYEYF